ncbi:MAG: hypothetical protein WAV18_17315 [Roseiarcus sp.]
MKRVMRDRSASGFPSPPSVAAMNSGPLPLPASVLPMARRSRLPNIFLARLDVALLIVSIFSRASAENRAFGDGRARPWLVPAIYDWREAPLRADDRTAGAGQ